MKFSGPKMSFSLIWGSRPMVPIVSFKETTGHGRVGFSMGGHSLVEVTRILISSKGSEKSFEMLPKMVWGASYEQFVSSL